MPKKILIVEDDNITRKSLQVALLNAGFEAHEATNGKEGLALALSEKPDLIMADIYMPELTGLEMIKQLRDSGEWGKRVPVMILTSDETGDSLNDALRLGVSVYFQKDNMDPSQIAEQIGLALEQNKVY